jgi:two-component system KDP operon response regulator KdpE
LGGSDAGPDGRLALGPVELDPVRREVHVAGNPVKLTPHEYELLKVLLSNQGRVVTRERILRAVWGLAYADAGQYVHVYVSRLRRKLSDAGAGPLAQPLFATEPGIGYRVADAETLREHAAADTRPTG